MATTDRHTEQGVPQAPILLVDDYPDVLEMYDLYMTYEGYRVLTASSGAAAIDLARTKHPAVILMDLQMSVMSGTEALRILRADPAFNGVHILAFTAHAYDNERNAALDAGFDDVILKPCLPEDLATVVERLLSTPRQTGPPDPAPTP